MCGRGEHQTQEQVVVAVKFQEEKQALIGPNRWFSKKGITRLSLVHLKQVVRCAIRNYLAVLRTVSKHRSVPFQCSFV